MKRGGYLQILTFLLPLCSCIFALGLTLYSIIQKQNQLTELRLQIPLLAKEVKAIQDENTALQYQVYQFEAPMHLLELSRKPEFSHMKHPLNKDIVIIE